MVLVLEWVLFALAVSPLIVGIGWAIGEGIVRPRLIPRAEIDRLADVVMARYPDDPEEAAFSEEHAAWVRSESLDQGRWRRVRKAISRRLAS